GGDARRRPRRGTRALPGVPAARDLREARGDARARRPALPPSDLTEGPRGRLSNWAGGVPASDHWGVRGPAAPKLVAPLPSRVMEIGVYTFAEVADRDPATRMRDLLEEAELAERVGLDVFGVGEHHRPDFLVSAPAVALAAVAARTERIRLTSAVTVLSSDDPVRVYQEFAEIDLLSGGRAEIMAGRGSFVESFPLFGYPLADYDELFAEKLELLLRIREHERVTWHGRHRAALSGLGDPGRAARPADGPRHHRREARAVRAVRGAPPDRRRRARPARAGRRGELAHVRGRDVGAGGRRVLPGVRRDDEPRRGGAWLAADGAADVRRAADARGGARRRQPGRRGGEDSLPARGLRPPAVPRAGERRLAAARPRPAVDRAPRHRGRASRPSCPRGLTVQQPSNSAAPYGTNATIHRLPATPRHPERLRRLQTLTDAALAHLRLDELLAALLERTRELLDVDTCAFLLLDEERDELVARAAVGIEEEVERGVRIPVGQGFAGRVAASREPVVLHDVDHGDVLNPILREKGIKSLLGVPLVVEGETIGVLHVGTLEHRAFATEEIELLQLAADRAAISI